MSRVAVRAAIAAYFGGNLVAGTTGKYQGGSVTGLGTVWLSPPKRFPAADFTAGQAAGARSGAMIVVRIDRQHETRLAGGRGAGIKRIGYQARLDVYHLSLAADSVQALADFDAFADALEARLRADPTLGGAVFSAGEGDESGLTGGAGYIDWQFGEPASSAERTETYAALSFPVVEHVTG